MRLLIAVLCLPVLVCPLRAQGDVNDLGELMPDRPGFIQGSGVTGRGVLQFEKGYSYQSTRSEQGRSRTMAGPQTMLRFGVAERIEVRFSTNGYQWRGLTSGDVREALSGPSDYAAGVKMLLLEQGSIKPEVAIAGGLSFPVRQSAFSTGSVDPQIGVAVFKKLPHRVGVTVNAGAAYTSEDRRRFVSPSEGLSIASPSVRGVSAFAEVFRVRDRVANSATIAGVGLFRSMGQHSQVDIEIGRTVTGPQSSWFAAFGFVFRNPRRIGFLKE